jgi:glycosyltransferase involved in cell wall biosynthesis
MADCSIVIRCFNEAKHIGRLLRGVAEQTKKEVEIIVVDSGSTDGTLEIARESPAKILQIDPSEFSFGRSLNIGCRAATSEFVVVVSAHVYPVYDTWLELLLAPFSDPRIALTYGKQRGHETSKYSEHQIFARWFPDQSNPDQDHPFCNNANAAIRRSIWLEMDYDETLTGLEDIDWAQRAMKLGNKLAYTANAEVVHVHNETPSRIFNRYRREALTFKRVFPREHFHIGDFASLLVGNIANDYYHALRDGVLIRNAVGIPTFRLMQFWGTYRGFSMKAELTREMRQIFYYPRGLARRVSDPHHDGREIAYEERQR